MRRLSILLLPFAFSVLSACRPDCRETLRTADFEFSQGNYVRAEKLYGEALKADPARCADAEGKRANARRFLGR
jgi:hypothetical protein